MLKDLLEEEEKIGVGESVAILAPPAERAAEYRARAQVYRLLSGVFIEEASKEFIAALRAPEMVAQLAEVGLRFDADFLDAPIDDLVDALAVEYTTLFVAPGGCQPVESVRLFGRFKQEPAFDTMAIYQRNGFVLRPGKHEVFADQLGVELLFVAELLERAAQALDSGNEAAARKLQKEIKRFWVQHLGRWVRGYARLVERAAQHSFYREMARFLAGFADEEIAAMGLTVEDMDQGRLEVPKVDVKTGFDPNEPVCGGRPAVCGNQDNNVKPLLDLR